MHILQMNQIPLYYHKIHFIIKKKVKFGEAIYVCGNINQLGKWNPQKSYKLNWNNGHIWSAVIVVKSIISQYVEYKYIISEWNNPNPFNLQWQVGSHNRRIDLGKLKSTSICNDRWNMDKISLNLQTSKQNGCSKSSYYVLGNIIELGNWKQRKQLKKSLFSQVYNQKNKSQQIFDQKIIQQQTYSFSFYTYRGRQQFFYYYIKKDGCYKSQRRPGRFFKFTNQKQEIAFRQRISFAKGQISIYQRFNVNQLLISQINQYIYIGTYPNSNQDIKKIKANNITAILSIQSQKDYKSHGLSSHFMELLCNENQITFRKYSIEDMNDTDFVKKSFGGVKVMRQLIRTSNKIYVHCTAGIYRSPQIIALYLSIFQNMEARQAIEMIRQKHPYAKPSYKVVKQVIELINKKKCSI